MTSILGSIDGTPVVHVCSDCGGTPPHRAWFVVDSESGVGSKVDSPWYRNTSTSLLPPCRSEEMTDLLPPLRASAPPDAAAAGYIVSRSMMSHRWRGYDVPEVKFADMCTV